MKKDNKNETILLGLLIAILTISVAYSIYQNIKCTTEPKNHEKSNVNTFHDSLYNDTLVYPFLKTIE
jgi:hypothetical protein